MNHLMRAFLISVALLFQTAGPAWAELLNERFSEARFEALQADGALILIDIYAPWCPTCAAQQKVLSAYQREHPEAKLHRLKVDFDKNKAWVTAFRAPRQSTLILFRGEKELWFSVAETRREKIFEALDAGAATKP
jgi:thioredoxin 1